MSRQIAALVFHSNIEFAKDKVPLILEARGHKPQTQSINLESNEMQQLSIATFGTTPQDPGVVHAGLKLKDGGNQ